MKETKLFQVSLCHYRAMIAVESATSHPNMLFMFIDRLLKAGTCEVDIIDLIGQH